MATDLKLPDDEAALVRDLVRAHLRAQLADVRAIVPVRSPSNQDVAQLREKVALTGRLAARVGVIDVAA